jgi:hypothetical protein
MQINQEYLSINDFFQRGVKAGQVTQANSEDVKFSKLYMESEIRLEIATKISKLPNPNVLVDPKAIAKMAADKNFYDKVMCKINAFSDDPNISLNYPNITYSLVVDENGDWVETMVNEDLKKLAEEAEKRDSMDTSFHDVLETSNPLLNTVQYPLPIDTIYDYNNILVDFKKRRQL